MSLINDLVYYKERQDSGNPVLSSEIENNRYFDQFIFDMVTDCGSCISNFENLFIAEYLKFPGKKIIEFIPGYLDNMHTNAIVDSERDKSYFVITNNYFHIINKFLPLGISIDLSTLKFESQKKNKLFTNLQKIEISGSISFSNIPGIEKGPYTLEVEMGKRTWESVQNKIEYHKLIHSGLESKVLNQISFHLGNKEKFAFEHCFTLTYSEELSNLFLAIPSQTLVELSETSIELSQIFDGFTSILLDVQRQGHLNNFYLHEWVNENFIIFNHNILFQNVLSINLINNEVDESDISINYANYNNVRDLYNLKIN